jgi:hypothetical protein
MPTDGNPFSLDDGVWLKAALHTHTKRSDGDLDPDAHVRHHEWMGFDVCAITDHWTLTFEKSTEHCLVITGAELAADPIAPGASPRSSRSASRRSRRTLAVTGVTGSPSTTTTSRPSGSQHGGRVHRRAGGAAFIAHLYWSGLPLEVLLSAEHVHGIELFNSSAARENGRGDSSTCGIHARDGRTSVGFATDDCHYPGFDIGGAWTMVRAAERSEPAVLQALRLGHTYASAGPAIRDVALDGRALEVQCSPARSVTLMSRYETGWAVRADARNRMEDSRVLERDDDGLVVRARFDPPMELPYRRLVIEDERGRRAWTNAI